jgi:hypothetical protein
MDSNFAITCNNESENLLIPHYLVGFLASVGGPEEWYTCDAELNMTSGIPAILRK